MDKIRFICLSLSQLQEEESGRYVEGVIRLGDKRWRYMEDWDLWKRSIMVLPQFAKKNARVCLALDDEDLVVAYAWGHDLAERELILDHPPRLVDLLLVPAKKVFGVRNGLYYISSACVDPDFENRDIGTEIMRTITQEVFNLGYMFSLLRILPESPKMKNIAKKKLAADDLNYFGTGIESRLAPGREYCVALSPHKALWNRNVPA
jgi:ribosomal protein S18 acetylase RimI-like enzyme